MAENWYVLGNFVKEKLSFTKLVSKMMCGPKNDVRPEERLVLSSGADSGAMFYSKKVPMLLKTKL